jgi:hypothetical protein
MIGVLQTIMMNLSDFAEYMNASMARQARIPAACPAKLRNVAIDLARRSRKFSCMTAVRASTGSA